MTYMRNTADHELLLLQNANNIFIWTL